ncbi:MAG: hypothetical protein RLZZ142_230 [Verrucomicrobiota bacterium]
MSGLLRRPVPSPRSSETLLRDVSRSFYLSLRFLPGPVRSPLGLTYLLARASDTLADTSLLPVPERILALNRLETAIHAPEPDALPDFAHIRVPHPGEQRLLLNTSAILAAFHAQPSAVCEAQRTVLSIIFAGQRQDLLTFDLASAEAPVALPSPEALTRYTYAVAGCVGEFWTRLCALRLSRFARAPLHTLLEHGRLFGQGLQLVNILRDLPEDLRSGRCYLPADQLAQIGLSPAELRSNPTAARPLFLHWLDTAQSWLSHGAHYEAGIRGLRLRFSVSLPRLLGVRTLRALRLAPPLETEHRVKVSRKEVLHSALLALGRSAIPRA